MPDGCMRPSVARHTPLEPNGLNGPPMKLFQRGLSRAAAGAGLGPPALWRECCHLTVDYAVRKATRLVRSCVATAGKRTIDTLTLS
jgi:hypothetical protein